MNISNGKQNSNENVWSVDDLDGGLSAVLSNLHGLGSGDMIDHQDAPAYDMT